jgi:hypothetical protein
MCIWAALTTQTGVAPGQTPCLDSAAAVCAGDSECAPVSGCASGCTAIVND